MNHFNFREVLEMHLISQTSQLTSDPVNIVERLSRNLLI